MAPRVQTVLAAEAINGGESGREGITNGLALWLVALPVVVWLAWRYGAPGPQHGLR